MASSEGGGGDGVSKGLSIKTSILGVISYPYVYDGDRKDAPPAPPEEDEWVVRNYSKRHGRVAQNGMDDVPTRAETHQVRYNTGTVYSHHSFSSIKRHAEVPRWPAGNVIRGNVHVGHPEEKKGMCKTAPKQHKWWANTKEQPVQIPESDRHARGVHVSTFKVRWLHRSSFSTPLSHFEGSLPLAPRPHQNASAQQPPVRGRMQRPHIPAPGPLCGW